MSYRHQELTSPEQTATALASPEQTATGKDISNPFIVGSLLKTIWLSKCNQVISNETMLSKANGYGKELIKSRLWPDFCDKHNMVAFLEKSTGSAGFHQIIDFITRSHVCYALTKKPEVCVSFIRQFWRSAEILTDDNGTVKIHATIDGHSLSITEGSLRRHLKLDDQDGITSLPTTEIFAQLALMGYATNSDKVGVLEADLTKTKKTYSSAYTKLILRVKKLEAQLKVGKARRHSRSHENKQVTLRIFVQEVTPTELIQDQEASGKASDEVSTAGLKKSTAREELPTVSTAEATLSTAGGTVTYSRRSAEKRSRKDKGKAILIEEEPKKKSKKDIEQEQLSFAEAIRLEEQMHEEQRAQIARDAEIARQWDEEERKRAMDEAESTKKMTVMILQTLDNLSSSN
ncbi:hypothetical protein Tco_0502262 [Tanacetum coccineum]